MTELLGLAAACFLAATLLPFPSEGALLAYLHLRPGHTALAVAVATVANTAGGMTSYLIGRLIPQRAPDARALAWVRRHGAPITFLAFLPFIGDALVLAAGWLRVHWLGTLVFSAAGRLARYAVIALLT
ncbi:MAG TPA: DedA family protein [Candidatus Binatia bacterium]|nr:DedA family protein [Candidatus Binatia bacterium]